MKLNPNSEKIAWVLVLIFGVIFVIALFIPTKKSQYKICYTEKDSVCCDTVKHYEMISFLGLDSCYTYTLEDSTQMLICSDCQIEKIK
jgi:hypothetical protein